MPRITPGDISNRNAYSILMGQNDPIRRRMLEVREQYGHSSLAYHNANHINSCIKAWHIVHDCFSSPHIAHLALWAVLYHDIVYDPYSRTNEEESAVKAYEALRILDYTEEDIRLVENMILATKLGVTPQNEDEALVKDIDISGFLFRNLTSIEESIRSEHSLIPDTRYYPGRRAVLRQLYARPLWSVSLSEQTSQIRTALTLSTAANHPTVGVAGTFDIFHSGHKRLLDAAMQMAYRDGRLQIAITSDDYASHKKHEVQPVEDRMDNISHYLDSHSTIPVGISIVDDPNDMDLVKDIDILVVSEDTLAGAHAILNTCSETGQLPPCIYSIPMVVNRNGIVVSSTGVRNGTC